MFKAYLLLYKHLKGFLHLVPWAYCRGIPGRTRLVRTQNADSLNYMIFLHAYQAIEFCLFPLPLQVLHKKTHTIQYTYLQIIVSFLDQDIHFNTYTNEFHENDLATRILAPILTDLVPLHKTCGIRNSSPSGFAQALPSKIVR